MALVGILFLLLASIFCASSLYFAYFAVQNGHPNQATLSRKANRYSSWAVLGASLVLLFAFLTNNFSFKYIVNNSARSLPTVYKITAFWAGQSGSLLLWVLIISFLILFIQKNSNYQKVGLDLSLNFIINLLRLCFLLLLIFVTPPFQRAAYTPHDGLGLNPMLQSLGMIVHPPLLFLGYSGLLVPFALALIGFGKEESNWDWLKTMRPWVLFSWLFLTAGIVTGGHWAYSELGWGGYWAWDPVENASLLPWLTSTALLHVLLLSKKHRTKELWCYCLSTATFALTAFSSFLTRSGIIDSVHAFAGGILGWVFLALLLIVIVVSIFIGIKRHRSGESLHEKNTSNLLNQNTNIILSSIVLILLVVGIFFGTMFPIISRTFLGREIILNESFYEQITVPLFLIIIFLMGVSPFLSQSEFKIKKLILRVTLPLLTSLAIFFWFLLHKTSTFLVALAFALGVFAFATHLKGLIRPRSKRQFGAYLVHLGIIFMLVGITGSSVYKEEILITVKPGEQVTFAGYILEYQGLKTLFGIKETTVETRLQVYKGDRKLGTLRSGKTFWEGKQQPSTKIGIRSNLKEDLYFNLAGWENPNAQLHLFRFALVSWIWIGSWIIYLGIIILLLPFRKRRKI